MPRRATSASCRWLGALLAVLVACLPGCGYTVSSVLPSYIHTIAIPTLANNTVEHGLADDITQALINSFQADRRLTSERERDADTVLRGTVLSYRNRVYAYTSQEVATQYEILLAVKVSLHDQVKNREIWKEDALTVRTTYSVVPVGSEPAKTEVDGRRDVIQKLADQIVSRTVQGW
jgi:outer membrane lipopolysaccharide assembly protein LptE/RlpB